MRNRRFRKHSVRPLGRIVAGCGLALALPLHSGAQTPNPLVTGKRITLPALGKTANVGSLPMNLALSPNGRFAVSTNMGYREYLTVIDTATGNLVAQLDYNAGLNAGAGYPTQGLYYGLVFNPTLNGDGTYTLYASVETGIDSSGNYSYGIEPLKLNAVTGTLTHGTQVNLKTGDFPAGLSLDARGNLYVAINEYFLNGGDANELLTPGRVAVLDAATLTEKGRVNLSATPLSNFPLSIAALADGSKVYVGSQRDGGVYVLNATNPAAPAVVGYLPTGAHPDSLLLNRNQSLLYVANAHSDTVSVIHTADNTPVATISLRPSGAQSLAGVSPTGLSLSADEKTLYVSLGDMNAVAAVDAAANKLAGYIPAGWYPTGVVNANGNLLISNAKGHQTRYANPTYQQYSFANAYDLNLIEGDVQTLPAPSSLALLQDTLKVYANNGITATTDHPTSNPLAGIGRQAGGITHVIYVIKENRTFDQVLGDIAADVPGANADPSLTLFGKSNTPNLHALVKRFALLDNFYTCSEASGDGWPWSTQSFATEYVIKNLPFNYSSRGRNYDFEGQNNGYPVGGFAPGLSVAFPAGAPPIPDVSEAPAHHIWDLARAAGLSFRNYGFFSSFGVGNLIPDNYPGAVGLLPAGHYDGTGPLDPAQHGYTDLDFRRFDMYYADSDAYANAGCSLGNYGHYNAQSRFAEWNREFQAMVAADPAGNNVPNFMTVRLPHDHTAGYGANRPTPQSMVADNDYGVGQLVNAVSAVPNVWKHTAIFVIEDDSQDGPDHVDTHRSTAYVISPYVKQGTLDHTFYNTDSVLHTMELLLGLPAMSQYDAIATPMTALFDTAPNNGAIYGLQAEDPAIICARTSFKPKDPRHKLVQLSARMDFAHPDSADPGLLNEILWKGIKGMNARMPAPQHSPMLAKLTGKKAVAARHTARAARTVRDSDD